MKKLCLEHQTLGRRAICPNNPANQRLYCRLSDFWCILINLDYRCDDEKRPPKERLVGGLTFAPGPFNVRVLSRYD